jgi:hypothetical protein
MTAYKIVPATGVVMPSKTIVAPVIQSHKMTVFKTVLAPGVEMLSKTGAAPVMRILAMIANVALNFHVKATGSVSPVSVRAIRSPTQWTSVGYNGFRAAHSPIAQTAADDFGWRLTQGASIRCMDDSMNVASRTGALRWM